MLPEIRPSGLRVLSQVSQVDCGIRQFKSPIPKQESVKQSKELQSVQPFETAMGNLINYPFSLQEKQIMSKLIQVNYEDTVSDERKQVISEMARYNPLFARAIDNHPLVQEANTPLQERLQIFRELQQNSDPSGQGKENQDLLRVSPEELEKIWGAVDIASTSIAIGLQTAWERAEHLHKKFDSLVSDAMTVRQLQDQDRSPQENFAALIHDLKIALDENPHKKESLTSISYYLQEKYTALDFQKTPIEEDREEIRSIFESFPSLQVAVDTYLSFADTTHLQELLPDNPEDQLYILRGIVVSRILPEVTGQQVRIPQIAQKKESDTVVDAQPESYLDRLMEGESHGDWISQLGQIDNW